MSGLWLFVLLTWLFVGWYSATVQKPPRQDWLLTVRWRRWARYYAIFAVAVILLMSLVFLVLGMWPRVPPPQVWDLPRPETLALGLILFPAGFLLWLMVKGSELVGTPQGLFVGGRLLPWRHIRIFRLTRFSLSVQLEHRWWIWRELSFPRLVYDVSDASVRELEQLRQRLSLTVGARKSAV